MKSPPRLKIIGALVLALGGFLLWEILPSQAVLSIAHLSDPKRLQTLGPRAANPRLNKIVYWLDYAERRGLPPPATIHLAQILNRTPQPPAALVKDSLLRNLRIAGELGLLTRENRERLRHGKAARVTIGPYMGSQAEVDHIVPLSLAPAIGNELANLELMPEPLNLRKSDQIGSRQMAHAARLMAAGLMSREGYARLKENAGL